VRRPRRGAQPFFAAVFFFADVFVDFALEAFAPEPFPAACFSRHSASCFVRRAFCFLRRGESCGVDMRAIFYARGDPGAMGHRDETDSSGFAPSTISSHCSTFPFEGPSQFIVANRRRSWGV